MGIMHYLAMTAAEYRSAPEIPQAVAWMACLFSPYGKGLSNLPRQLPPGALLMVSDITPLHGQDPGLIGEQLLDRVEDLHCLGVLLDLQRPGEPEAASLAAYLTRILPCPVCVSLEYGRELDCPLLLPPVPCHVRLSDFLAPWKGREIWLETALDAQLLTLTEEGCQISLPTSPVPDEGFQENILHCHYQIQDQGSKIDFTLWRRPQDHQRLLEEAESQGIALTLGLYQEFA